MRPSKRLLVIVSVVSIVVLLLGCGGLASSAAPTRLAEQAVGEGEARGLLPELPAATAAPAAGAAPVQDAGGTSVEPTAAAQAGGQRMVIQTANIVARVRDVQVAVAEARRLAESYGGYVVSLNTWAVGDSIQASVTIRVPAASFDQLLAQVSALADKVDSSSITGQDVTEEYFDIEARLRALKATEEQLTLLLADVRERMKTAEDILAVYRELQNIQSQIEQLQGRKQFLESQVALSTVNLSLLPSDLPVVAVGWRPLGTVREALRSLSRTGQGLVDVLIWIVLYLVPIALVLLAPLVVLYVIVRAIVRRRRNGRKVAPPPPPAA